MSTTLIAVIILLYFLLLLFIAKRTSKGATNDSFFVGDKKSPWLLVAFGMIGTSLSGVTFLSVPGWVGNSANQFSYMQMVFGYLVGYFVVALVLMPLYYRLNLTSIYSYLGQRFGPKSHMTGAVFFLGSRVIGASIRLLLVANVLQEFLFESMGIPFPLTVIFSILLIWVYTNKGGIKTIIWTDSLQTFFMIAAVLLTVHFISDAMGLYDQGVISTVANSEYAKIFFFDDMLSGNYFWKHFIGGAFITIGMTGLDQDMMQKNLSCKSIGDAKKNMLSFAFVLVIVNAIFLGLGALLYMYSKSTGIASDVASGDLLFPTIALHEDTSLVVGILFFVGLIAAAYSSADSALTSLTTSFSLDVLKIQNKPDLEQEKIRKRSHVLVSVVLLLVIILLKYTTERSAIDSLIFFAGFTYGPLIGIFFFGILSERSVNDILIPVLSLISVFVTVGLWMVSPKGPIGKTGEDWLGGYTIGAELIIINGLITFILLFACSKKAAATN